jgi:hypothetical protein
MCHRPGVVLPVIKPDARGERKITVSETSR